MNKVKLLSVIAIFVVLAIYTDYLVYPDDGSVLDSTRVGFRKIGLGNILVDDNIFFTSPIKINPPFILELSPGLYFWRGTGISEIYNFTISSKVALNLKLNGTYQLENAGNVKVNVTIANRRFSPLGYAILDVGSIIDLNLTDEILIGKQDE